MINHVAAPRLLFLYPRVARLALSPDSRGQLIFPDFVEHDRNTALALASASASAQSNAKRSKKICSKPLGDIGEAIRSCDGRSRSRSRIGSGSGSRSRNRRETCQAISVRKSHGHLEVRLRERACNSRSGGLPTERRRFHTSAQRQQSIKPQRYGTANEPPPYLEDKKGSHGDEAGNVKDDLAKRGQKRGGDDEDKHAATVEGKAEGRKTITGAMADGETKDRNELFNERASRATSGRQHLYRADGRLVEINPDNEADVDEDAPVSRKNSPAEILHSRQMRVDSDDNGSKSVGDNHKDGEADEAQATQEAPLQTFLQAQPSKMLDNGTQKQLLLRNSQNSNLSSSANPSSSSHFHHFDTYTIARNLQDGGFSEQQAVTTMKAMRLTLAENLKWARKGLVSKSNVENDTYLFRAACSELRTEVQHNRKKAADRMRNERNQLEREAEILNQRFQQESQNLKDELRGMFDDRKMAVRMDQKAMESRIQELDYTITVALRSDARSAVEGLRWILVRRAAIAIVISAVMILATLRYSSYMSHTQELERRKMEAGQQANNSNGKSADYSASDNSPSTGHPPINNGDKNNDSSADEEILVRAQEGGGPGYVSLG